MKRSKPDPRIAVLIPIYKTGLSEYEAISLRQCCTVLGHFPLILVKPHSLSIEPYTAFKSDFEVEPFDDVYFRNTGGYNRLMLSPEFYTRFLDYDYILIHQLDAFVFKDELLDWCKRDYDYIGAPWLSTPLEGGFLRNFKRDRRHRKAWRKNLKQKGTDLPVDLQFLNMVGNGGFSLRKVVKFQEICHAHREIIDFYKENCERHHFFNEDVFWSMEVNRRSTRLRIPGYKKAVAFSIEFCPEYAFKLTGGKLPFGCHAWDLYSGFWRSKLQPFNYNI
jgi:hypothetical protein